jgi:hypothetical protein
MRSPSAPACRVRVLLPTDLLYLCGRLGTVAHGTAPLGRCAGRASRAVASEARRRARRCGIRLRVSERAALTGNPVVLRGGGRGRCHRVKWDTARAARAGDAWWSGNGPASGVACMRPLLAELRRRGRLDQRWTVVDSGSVRAMRGKKWTEPNRPRPSRLPHAGVRADLLELPQVN